MGCASASPDALHIINIIIICIDYLAKVSATNKIQSTGKAGLPFPHEDENLDNCHKVRSFLV